VSTSTVTVGVPVYNGENYLGRALDSLVNQTRRPDQVLIYDNSSTDSTFEIAQAYARDHPSFHVVRRDQNVGAALNFNELVTQSSSTYFSWLCHDDKWDSNLLEESVKALETDPEASVAFAVPNWINSEDDSIGAPAPVVWSDSRDARIRARELLADDVHSLLFDCNAVHGLIRRRDLERTRLIRPFPGGDVPLIFELALLGRLRPVFTTHFNRRQHEVSSMKANADAWARQEFYDPTEERPPAEMLERFRDYLRSSSNEDLAFKERLAIRATILHWAVRNRRPRRILGQLVRRLIIR